MSKTDEILMRGIREGLADLSHDIWSHWMRWQFSRCTQNDDGSMTIPADKVERWKRQMETTYQNLSEAEKQSDRQQADKIMSHLNLTVSDPQQ